MRSRVVRYLGFVGVLIAPSSGIWAAEIYSFTSIDVPGATSGTGARGINNAGQIVGEFYTSEPHGFLKDGVTFTTIDVPSTLGGQPFGINDAGRIVGTFFDARGNHGFLKTSATFATIDVAGATRHPGPRDQRLWPDRGELLRWHGGPRVSQGRRNFHDDRCSRRDRHRSLHLLKRDQRRHGRDLRRRHGRGHRAGGSGGDLRGVPTGGHSGQEGRRDRARLGPVPEVHRVAWRADMDAESTRQGVDVLLYVARMKVSRSARPARRRLTR